MKRCMIFALILSCLLCGCSSSEAEPAQAAAAAKTEVPAQTEAAVQTTASAWTEEEVLEAFRQHARDNMEVIDCVIMDSSVCDIVGVVQYHLGDPAVCRFDFMKADGMPCRMGMEFVIDGENTFACAGEDRVSCRMLREDGTPYLATILYYEDAETGEKGFKVSES